MNNFYWADSGVIELYKKNKDDKVVQDAFDSEWFDCNTNILYYYDNYRRYQYEFENEFAELNEHVLYTLTEIFMDADDDDEFRNYTFEDIKKYFKTTNRHIAKKIISYLVRYEINEQDFLFSSSCINRLYDRKKELLEVAKDIDENLYKELKMELILGKVL